MMKHLANQKGYWEVPLKQSGSLIYGVVDNDITVKILVTMCLHKWQKYYYDNILFEPTGRI
jgi:hypothetical protein